MSCAIKAVRLNSLFLKHGILNTWYFFFQILILKGVDF